MKYNQLKAGAFLSYISIILNNIIGLVYTPFLLRMLGQNEYGLYSLVASVVSYLTVLDLGFANAIVRYTAKFRAKGEIEAQYKMFGMFLLLYCGIGFIALLIGVMILFNVDSLFDSTMTANDLYKVRIMMGLMVLNVAFTFPMSIWGAIITAYEDFVFQKIVNLLRIILNPLCMVVLLFLGYKAIAMVVVITVFNIITLIINAVYCKTKLNIKVKFGKFNTGFLKEVSIYSFWIFLNVIVDRIYWNTGQFILGMVRGAVAISIYALAIQLVHIYMSFSTAISGVLLPKITAMVIKSNNEKEVSNLFIKTSRLQYILIGFILSGFILFGKPFIVLWAGEEYADTYLISLLLFVSLSIPLVQNIGITILQAKNQMEFRAILYIIVSIFSLFLSYYLAKKYGGIGCAIGTSIALVIGQIIIMNIYYYKKIHLDIPAFWNNIIRMSIVPAVLCVIFYPILAKAQFLTNSFLSLSVTIIIFSLLYAVIYWITSLNEYEKGLLTKPLRKLYYDKSR